MHNSKSINQPMTAANGFRLILVMVLWAICFPLITMGLDSVPHLGFAAMRAFLAGVALLVVGAALRRPFPSDRNAWGILGVVGIGATTLGFLGMFHAAEYVSPGVATVIASTQPLMAAVLAHFLLQERLDTRSKAGLLLGFLGIVLIAAPNMLPETSGEYAKGIAYIVLSALGITIANVAMKSLAGRVDALMGMGIQLVLGAFPLTVLALATEDSGRIQWSLQFGAVLLVLALLGTSVVFWLWFSVLKQVELSRANAFNFLVPVFGLAIGAGLFGETIGWTSAIGATLTIVGIAFVNVPRVSRVPDRRSIH